MPPQSAPPVLGSQSSRGSSIQVSPVPSHWMPAMPPQNAGSGQKPSFLSPKASGDCVHFWPYWHGWLLSFREQDGWQVPGQFWSCCGSQRTLGAGLTQICLAGQLGNLLAPQRVCDYFEWDQLV